MTIGRLVSQFQIVTHKHFYPGVACISRHLSLGGVENATRRPVFGSVHRIVPRSTAMLRTSERAARTASAMTPAPSIRPIVTAIASALMIMVICLDL